MHVHACDCKTKERVAWHSCGPQSESIHYLLLPYVAVPVDAAAAEEAVVHHGLGKQENSDDRGDEQQEPSNLERWRPCSLWGSIIPVS